MWFFVGQPLVAGAVFCVHTSKDPDRTNSARPAGAYRNHPLLPWRNFSWADDTLASCSRAAVLIIASHVASISEHFGVLFARLAR